MTPKKTLFIYDCDGTICAPTFFAYATYKKNPDFNLSLAEFKEKHNQAQAVILPGMADLIQYTKKIGNNVLLSGGDPMSHNDPELKNTFSCFKNWKYNGTDVPFGQKPENISKEHPSIAENLVDNFNPDRAVVFGDSEEEFILAQNLATLVPTTFIFRGPSGTLFQSFKGIQKYCALNGTKMLNIIQKLQKKHKGPSVLAKYRVQNKTEVVKVLKEFPKSKNKRVQEQH